MANRLFLLLLAAPLLVGACTTSGNIPPVATDAGDASVPVPPTSACTGDATLCLSGSLALATFTSTPTARKVELYRVYPGGGAAPVASQPLALDGTFAFSNLAPWGHYYLKGIARFGDPKTGTSVATLQGRFAVPTAGASPVALTVIPAQLELLETTSKGAMRSLQWVSAHVFDPATGSEITDATLSVQGTGLPATPVPYATNLGGAKSYFASFATPPQDVTGVTLHVAHTAFGASGASWKIGQEAPSFDEPAITAPASGASIPIGQALAVTWAADPPQADYAVIAFFLKSAGQYTSKYATQTPLAADVATDTVPAADISQPGSYLLDVNVSQTTCGGPASDGCANLFHAASATITAQ